MQPKFKTGDRVIAVAIPDGFPHPQPQIDGLVVDSIRLIECTSIPSYYRITAYNDETCVCVEAAESFFAAA